MRVEGPRAGGDDRPAKPPPRRSSARSFRHHLEALHRQEAIPAGTGPGLLAASAGAGAAPPAEAAPPSAAGTPSVTDVRAVVAWIARAAAASAAGPGALAVVVRDPRLGIVRLQVTVKGRRARIVARADRPGTQAALIAERPALREDLARRGIVLEALL